MTCVQDYLISLSITRENISSNWSTKGMKSIQFIDKIQKWSAWPHYAWTKALYRAEQIIHFSFKLLQETKTFLKRLLDLPIKQ
jgi:hypothetical protein